MSSPLYLSRPAPKAGTLQGLCRSIKKKQVKPTPKQPLLLLETHAYLSAVFEVSDAVGIEVFDERFPKVNSVHICGGIV